MFAFLLAFGFVSQSFSQGDPCSHVHNEELCNYTFGCTWAGSCELQEGYTEGSLDDAPYDCSNPAVGAIPTGYICYYDADTNKYFVYVDTYYDGCSFYDVNKGECPDYSEDSIPCVIYEDETSGDEIGCYEFDCTLHPTDPLCCVDPSCPGYCTLNPTDVACNIDVNCQANEYAAGCRCDLNPWYPNCYLYKTNAGICEGLTPKGCGAIPFCHWNSSKCQPDWKCYYTDINTGVCDTTSSSDGGAGCKSELVGSTRYCTSDLITSKDEECILAGANQETCESGGCEWVPEGSTQTAGHFDAWCTQIGSGTSVARISSVVLMILLSVMLTFF